MCRVVSSSVILVVGGGGSGKHHVGLGVLDKRFGDQLFLSADIWIIDRVPITNFYGLLKRSRSSRDSPLSSPIGSPYFYRQFITVIRPSAMVCQWKHRPSKNLFLRCRRRQERSLGGKGLRGPHQKTIKYTQICSKIFSFDLLLQPSIVSFIFKIVMSKRRNIISQNFSGPCSNLKLYWIFITKNIMWRVQFYYNLNVYL